MKGRVGWLLLLVLEAAACDRRGYVAITVKLGTLAGRVDRLALQAFDARGDAGPMLIPVVGPDPQGIPNNSVISVATPIGNSLTVVVNGLGADGGSLGVGSATVASATANTQVTVTIAVPCLSQRDCDPNAVCLGNESCLLGTCQATTLSFADAGAACGPSDGGHCNGDGFCLLPYCGTGLHPLPSGEQCDEGVALNGNLPDHCRANCRLPSCGDDIVDPDGGEICDLGSLKNGQGLGCNATCNLTGTVTILAGNGTAISSDGRGQDAGFDGPGALAVIGSGLYVADELSHLVRRIDLTSLEVTTIAGGFDGGACHDTNGVGPAASFCLVGSMLAYNDGLIVGDVSALRLVNVDDGEVSSFAGALPNGHGEAAGVTLGFFSMASYGDPLGLALVPPDIYSSTTLAGEILASDPITSRVSLAGAPFPAGEGGGLTAVGQLLFAGDTHAGVVAALAPDLDAGAFPIVASGLLSPHGLCSDGQSVYVAEFGGHRIQQITLDAGSGTLSLLAGTPLGEDGGGYFEEPEACVYDSASRALYVSDLKSNLIFAIH